ncbi:hypothetical protein [Asticcacaulis sp.]|uniref:hypothetical protein n=1 Tax=Asticcacaulis sp. TaxID=1872648 RepID=UPI0026339C0F|nr:hypothetical protein [Asticcacaulis sp.]
MTTKKKISFTGALFRILGFSLLGGMAVGALSAVLMLEGGVTDRTSILATAGALMGAVMIVVAGVYSIRWWQSVDEAVRHAHAWAWYWGGSAGLAISTLFFIVFTVTDGVVARALMQKLGYEGGAVEFGMILTAGPMLLGYGIAWGIWWLRHR